MLSCVKCSLYCVSTGCKAGKANPANKVRTLATFKAMGIEYICDRNQYKAKIIQLRDL